MIKKYFLFLKFILVFLLPRMPAYCQSLNIQNSSIFGGTGQESPINFIKTSDSGFVAILTTNSTNTDLLNVNTNASTLYTVMVVKYNSNLLVEWKKAYLDLQGAGQIAMSSDNNFSFLGVGRGINQGFFIKISNIDGSIISQTTLNSAIYPTNFISLSNGNFVSVGTVTSPQFVGSDFSSDEIQVTHFNNLGQILWQRKYGGYNKEKAINVFDENGIITVFGTTNSDDKDVIGNHRGLSQDFFSDVWMFKLDPTSGNIQYQRCFGGSGNEILYSALRCINGDYIIATSISSFDYDSEINSNSCCSAALIRLNNLGESKWQINISGNDRISMVETLDSSIHFTDGSVFKRISKNGDVTFDLYSLPFGLDFGTNFKLLAGQPNTFYGLGTKSNTTSAYLGKNVYINKFQKTTLPIQIKELSKNRICNNAAFTVTIDTSGIFNPGNQFKIVLLRNSSETIVGTSTNSTTINGLSPILSAFGESNQYYLKITSTNPVYSTPYTSFNVQTSSNPVINVPDSVFRGAPLQFSTNFNYAGQHFLKVNNTWYNTLETSIFLNEYIGENKTYNFTQFKNVCGTYPLNFSKTVKVVEKMKPGLIKPPKILWEKTIGGKREDVFNDIENTIDNGLIVASKSISNDLDFTNLKGYYDAFLTKLNPDGSIAWTKNYGGENLDFIKKIKPLPDGNFITIGYTGSNTGDLQGQDLYKNGWTMKLDNVGNILWSKKYGIFRDAIYYGEELEDVKPTTNGSYLLAGRLDNYFGIRKIDAVGNEIWVKKIGDEGGWAYSIETDSLGYIYAAGVIRSISTGYNGGFYDMYFVKLDPDGNIIYTKNFGGSGIDIANQLKLTSDGGFILLGSSDSNNGNFLLNKGSKDVAVLKLNNLGNFEWSKMLGTNNVDEGYSIIEVSDGYIIGARTDGSQTGDLLNTSSHNSDSWIIKINSQGNIRWQKVLGGNAFEGFSKSIITSNGDYVIAGTKNSGDGDSKVKYGESDIWIVRLENIPECLNLKIVNSNISNESSYIAKEKVIGINKIENVGRVIYKANKSIELNHGFEAKLGSVFKTELFGCEN
jgi:hypothetical protein